MASTQSSHSTVRAGLVYQAVGLNEHLKVALGDAGVDVVVECLADRLVVEQIRSSNLDVFVVNLDPELEDHLDEVTDLLDQIRRPVIFNDGAASSGLGGWDQARWARHLAAKIKGELDSHPPRPENAPSIPMPQKRAVAPAVVAQTAATVELLAIPAELAAAKAPMSVAPIPSGAIDELDSAFTELDLDFAASAPLSAESLDEASVMADFDASVFDLPELSETAGKTEELTDLDALLSAAPLASAPLPSVARPSAANAAPASSDAFGEFSLNLDDDFSAPAAVSASQEERIPAPSSWALEPLESELPAVVPTGRAVYVAKEIENAAALAAQQAALKKPEAKAAAPVVSDDLDFGDIDFFGEAKPAPVATSSPEPVAPPKVASANVITKQIPVVPAPEASAELSDFDELFAELGAPDPATASASAKSTLDASDGLDFDLDLEIGVPQANHHSADTVLDDFAELDSLFADPPSTRGPASVAKVSSQPTQAGPAHVYVLGASIGGPEAVKSFLSKLKTATPAAFVLAQHMGAEFLELMTSQLAKASPIPVRLAASGALFNAGEVVVVPVSQRFLVDEAGTIKFAALPNESPYSPSIDQVMVDMAERFGARCTGIIFSGMASDAIEGAKFMASRGCKVWVQDPATCVISSMIDGAQAAGVVSFVGAPEQLADHVLDTLGVTR